MAQEELKGEKQRSKRNEEMLERTLGSEIQQKSSKELQLTRQIELLQDQIQGLNK